MSRPNIVFILSDQHRWDFMGYENNGTTLTPNLDRLSADGARFRSAYCVAPLCCPSRAAIASGRYGMNTGCFTNLHELPAGTQSFVSQLRDNGYRTCAIGKTHMRIHAYDQDLTTEENDRHMNSLGWDEAYEVSGNGMLKTGIKCRYSEFLKENGAFGDVLKFYRNWHYFMEKGNKGNPDFTSHEWTLEDKFQETDFLGAAAMKWIKERDTEQPFFLHLGFAGPHSPIEPNPRFLELYKDAAESPAWNGNENDELIPEARRGYRAMISQIDFWIGQLHSILKETGELENTIFVYTSDHGEMAGDHGRTGKVCFYEGSVRVPLIFSGPGINKNLDSSALVENMDIGVTLCELCGVEPHSLDQGKSLLPVLCGETETHRDTVYAEMGCDRMLFDGRYKLMWGDPGSDTRKLGKLHLDKPVTIPASPAKLYDLAEDPHETNDLLADNGNSEMKTEMLQKLLARVNENIQPRPNLSRGEYVPPEA